MRLYLVIAAQRGDNSLPERLERLAARDPGEFHIVVPRGLHVTGGFEPTEEQRVEAVVGAVQAQGLAADGEVGELSVVGSVARAAERAHYDALVVPLPGTNGIDAIDLGVACRLHQIDIPEVVVLTPWSHPAP
jgi:hypothetical protein